MHPFTSLTLWLWLSASSLFLPLGWPLALLGCSTFMVLLLWQPARHRWRVVAWIMIPMAAGLWLIHSGWLAQILTGDTLKNSRPDFAMALWFRLLTIISGSQLWLQFVPTERFIRALFASRLPASFAYLLAGPLLLVEQLRQQLITIREAQIARGVPLNGGIWQRITSLPALLFPLASNTLNELSIRSAALDMRGFRYSSNRTTLNPPADSLWQISLRYGLVIFIFIEGGLALWW
ncbi:energy-coupling factor transporter transmembrane protein EcfT [Providencia rettgeri]|nr:MULTISPECIES: energy-coupling factor transporter transmembrane component T [Providencia]EIL1984898.1 energy-coupling factor transporter transmembrane protein EcfT [Providencia rettgeri]EIU7556265.1 energy-coupling factor transporter transmembrane protein EcfT [Providencia rettgeri]EIU9516526.1 energy-coupling factor transporter transmembrane protein EcfT [Providencia rettgeri]EJD6041165.1 energy-coupling factor transporter transmembrane protein EcfT [Providencia rettgeri]EJD6368881.1 energy